MKPRANSVPAARCRPGFSARDWGPASVVFVLAATALAAHAQTVVGVEGRTPTEWLQAMDGAFRTLDYDGVFSYYAASHSAQVGLLEEQGPRPGQVTGALSRGARGGTPRMERALRTGSRTTAKLATFRIVHMVIDGIERERIVHLNGPRREILRTGDEVAYLLTPGDALLDLEGATPGGAYGRVFARRFENIAEHYDVVVKGRDRVAGRPATHLQVIPRDEDRLGYRLWLDDASGLLLRSELRDPSRTNLEIFQFTSLLVGDEVDPENLVSTTQGALIRQLAVTADDAAPDDPSWRAGWVPAGFELTSTNTQSLADDPHGLSMLTFSDGLAAFSVFVEAMPETGAGHVVSRSGATVALTHMAASARGNHLVTVVGEVPISTARRIAASVDHKSSSP